ncbi:hypothetical protein SNEBB_000492 [Seison nebaliae]|nr:hypothetical protein SNEBB_000492 [Seison nebaliae]
MSDIRHSVLSSITGDIGLFPGDHDHSVYGAEQDTGTFSFSRFFFPQLLPRDKADGETNRWKSARLLYHNRHFVAGWLGGAAGILVGHPFDTIKARQQTSQYNISVYHTAKDLIRREKMSGFFKGLSFPIVCYGGINSIYFGVYGYTLQFISKQRNRSTENETVQHKKMTSIVCASFLSGAIAAIPTCPVEVIKIRLQIDKTAHPTRLARLILDPSLMVQSTVQSHLHKTFISPALPTPDRMTNLLIAQQQHEKQITGLKNLQRMEYERQKKELVYRKSLRFHLFNDIGRHRRSLQLSPFTLLSRPFVPSAHHARHRSRIDRYKKLMNTNSLFHRSPSSTVTARLFPKYLTVNESFSNRHTIRRRHMLSSIENSVNNKQHSRRVMSQMMDTITHIKHVAPVSHTHFYITSEQKDNNISNTNNSKKLENKSNFVLDRKYHHRKAKLHRRVKLQDIQWKGQNLVDSVKKSVAASASKEMRIKKFFVTDHYLQMAARARVTLSRSDHLASYNVIRQNLSPKIYADTYQVNMPTTSHAANLRPVDTPYSILRQLIRERGIFRGPFHGLGTQLCRDVPALGSYMLCYEYFMSRSPAFVKNANGQHSTWYVIIAGGLTGCISWVMTMPQDVVKTRMQSDHLLQPKYRSMFDCYWRVWKYEGGVRTFFRGTLAATIRAFPCNAVTFLLYDRLLKYLSNFK